LTATVVIAVVAVLVVGWLAFLVASSIRNRSNEEVPRNVAPGKTDDELESKRLEKVQAAAVVLTGFLAFYLPIYYLGEQDRQAGFVEEFDEESLERGAEVVAAVGWRRGAGSMSTGRLRLSTTFFSATPTTRSDTGSSTAEPTRLCPLGGPRVAGPSMSSRYPT
jgi:hypothetical protein